MFNYNHTNDFSVNTSDAWYSRKASVVNLFHTAIAVTRQFIIAGKDEIADAILESAIDAEKYFSHNYYIKVWDGGENFTTLKYYKPDKILAIANNTDSAKVYLHEFETIKGDEECINLAIIIDRTNGEEEIA